MDSFQKLAEARMEPFLRRLKTLIYEEKRSLRIECCLFSPMVPFEQRLEGHYRPIGPGESWGENWDRAWFRLRGQVPAEWKDREVCAHIDLGGEGLIFDGNGVPRQGLSVHTIWPHPDFDRKRFFLFDPARGEEEIDLWVEASAGELFGLELQPDVADSPPETYGRHRAVIGECFLAVFRKDIWRLFLEASLLFDLMKSLPENSVRRKRILRVLGAAADVFSPMKEDVGRSSGALRPELDKPNAPSDLRTTAVGHAHIDTAWLWPLEETVRKCGRTFANQLDLIDRCPGYVFGASQAQHYAFVRDAYPVLYSHIRDKIREGTWEVQGGMWVEADCNLIGGESMVRQILHGKTFFREEFDVDVRFLWLPDVFGYSAAMPQILLKSGMESMVTQKISWNQFNRFPHHSFYWRGLDGSEVVVHFPPEDNYNSLLRPSELRRAQDNFAEGDFLDEFLTLFGVGDGGGGPTEESLETGLMEKNLEGVPAVRFGKAGEFLESLLKKKAELPVWAGELYLEMHRGTYTTQAANKKMNRKMELSLRAAEMLSSALPPGEYPMERLDALWKTVLLNQFHDIIPGSSITPVYEESREQYRRAMEEVNELTLGAGDRLFARKDGRLCLVNTLSS
ncbi:MAG: alpha-mannosidase 2c1, partial [Candidatus Aminicenantes bacterium]|nr:alpha-mannosidase 2c1 [Candidatus Aminicenantes bacterium]